MNHSDLLTRPQRNHFAVLLAMMEDSLAEMERLLRTEPASDGRLTRMENDLAPDMLEHMEAHFTAVREQIRTLSARLEIEPRRASRLRAIRAIVTSELVRIEDSYANKLRGYGAVNPSTASVVDPAMDALHAEFAAMGRLLKGSVRR